MELKIVQGNKTLQYKPTFFSLFNTSIIIGLGGKEIVLNIGKEDKIYKNGNRIFHTHWEYEKDLNERKLLLTN